MPNITFNAKDIGRRFTAREFDRLVEEVGMEVEERAGDDITLAVTPNRPDMLSFTGFMRALELHAGKSRPRTYDIKGKPTLTVAVTGSVAKVRPFIAGLVATGLKLDGNSLKYVIDFTEKLSDNYGRRRRKLAMGMHDMKAVKGDLVYDAKHDGSLVPLRGSKPMAFAEVLKSHAKGGEYGYTISQEGNSNYPFLRDSEKVISLIPIINSDATRVTERTSAMFVDVTGIDKNAVDDAARMMACMLMDMGATVLQVKIAYPNGDEISPSMHTKQVKVMLKDFEERIGVSSNAREMAKLAAREGYAAKVSGAAITVSVPQYRTDVFNEQDVIEDLAIAYGYTNIKPAPISGHAVGAESAANEYLNGISMLMVGLGFSEAMNYYLSNEKVQFDSMRRGRSKSSITVAKSKTEAITMLRESVLPGLLQNLSDSAHERMPQRLFEIGSVFRLENGKPVEETHLAFVSEHSKANFSEAKSIIEAIARHLGAKAEYRQAKDGAFIEGRCAAAVGGLFGEISPEVLEAFRIEEPVVAGELVLATR